MKEKTFFICKSCGNEHTKWSGQCKFCLDWDCIVEANITSKKVHYAGESSQVKKLSEVNVADSRRILTGSSEFDRVIGGGLIKGSVILLGGDPGIGKSTLLSQCISYLSKSLSTIYISGEESLQQISSRASRLNLLLDSMHVLTETCIENMLSLVDNNKYSVMVIDSVQTIFTNSISAAPGGVSQIRESAAKLIQYAKNNNIILFLVGHVTKEGTLAGPRVLEHMVDTVLYFEGTKNNNFRMVRAVKNRFGQVNELGIFAMLNEGLKDVKNSSAIFISSINSQTPGSVITVMWEGTRPILLEVQALVDDSQLPQPRRLSVGVEQSRLTMLLAIINKFIGIKTFNKDIFINVVGGVKINETSADLSIILTIISSIHNKVIPRDWCVIGEVGLTGEIRPISNGVERLREVAKHGFKNVILPKLNCSKNIPKTLSLHPVSDIKDLLSVYKLLNI